MVKLPLSNHECSWQWLHEEVHQSNYLYLFILSPKDLKMHKVKMLVRTCEKTYDEQTLREAGIDIIVSIQCNMSFRKSHSQMDLFLQKIWWSSGWKLSMNFSKLKLCNNKGLMWAKTQYKPALISQVKEKSQKSKIKILKESECIAWQD